MGERMKLGLFFMRANIVNREDVANSLYFLVFLLRCDPSL